MDNIYSILRDKLLLLGEHVLHNNTLVTVPVFDTKHMIISLLSDPSVMNKKNFAEGYDVLTGKVDNQPANNK